MTLPALVRYSDMEMTTLTTRKEYELLPEGTRVELCDGMLVRQPSPRYGHQRVQAAILKRLHSLVETARAVPGPVDVLVDEINVFVPDIVVLDRVPADDDQYVGVPLAVFEILSPSTKKRDRDFKTRRLLGLGVKEVWLVDGEQRTIDVVCLNEVRTFKGAKRANSDVIRGFRLAPDDVFEVPKS